MSRTTIVTFDKPTHILVFIEQGKMLETPCSERELDTLLATKPPEVEIICFGPTGGYLDALLAPAGEC